MLGNALFKKSLKQISNNTHIINFWSSSPHLVTVCWPGSRVCDWLRQLSPRCHPQKKRKVSANPPGLYYCQVCSFNILKFEIKPKYESSQIVSNRLRLLYLIDFVKKKNLSYCFDCESSKRDKTIVFQILLFTKTNGSAVVTGDQLVLWQPSSQQGSGRWRSSRRFEIFTLRCLVEVCLRLVSTGLATVLHMFWIT